MTNRLSLAPRAQSDLDGIWDYTAAHWGVDQAEIYVRKLWRDIAALTARPSLGRACPEVRAGYHRFSSGSHILFYRLSAAGIDVVRILHRCTDYEQHIP